MKQSILMGIVFVSGIVLGSMGVQELNATDIVKKPVYLVGEVDVTDIDGYTKEYSPKVRATVKAAGGRVVALGSSEKQDLIALDGAPAKRVFIQVWNDVDQMQSWFNSSDYKEARKIGDKYATFRHFVVFGAPQ